jgi:FAD/FMN-containing dehydrogenase
MTPDFLAALHGLLDPSQILRGDEASPWLAEQRGRYHSLAVPVVFPRSTAEVAAVVRLCAAHAVSIVPQGGNTGLVGGSVVTDTRQILLNLRQMQTIRDLDPVNFTMTVEAGCTLAAVKAAAAQKQRLFPLGLAVADTCQIGGNIASNAGGVNVLKYGTMRELVLGLEVVLPDGTLLSDLARLRKNNTGIDLKQLFIGSEGALGIITAAVLKLWPQPRQERTPWLGFDSLAAAMQGFVRIREQADDSLAAFELMSAASLALVAAHRPALTVPGMAPWAALVSLVSGQADGGALARLAAGLGHLPGVITAHLATSDSERDHLWHIRRALPWVQREAGGSIKHDVSVPLSAIAAFVAEADAAVAACIPGARPVTFGHAGDGNMHYNILQPEGADTAAFLARWEEVNTMVHRIALHHGGSFSAEHGIGLAKIAALRQAGNSVALDLRRQLKVLLDPAGRMNPGKGIA